MSILVSSNIVFGYFDIDVCHILRQKILMSLAKLPVLDLVVQ